ncbi:MAG TPA: PD-(D/E)XK nuclease family protein, partial [Acidobacteriota bacterium]|nr:PD-(D/E)XK nuclease family protein [Acidobacteriota bacterium]
GGFSWDALSQFCEEKTEEELRETLSFTSEETEFIKKVAALVSRRQTSFSSREAIDLLESVATWLEDPTIITPVSEAVVAMRSESLIPREALAVILEAAIQDETFSDLVDRPGVLLVPLMRARGLTGRAVVLLGLSSNRFPSRIEEDPLLSDESRRRLRRKAGQVGHRLPVKSHATDEMSLLFFLLNTSANRVHWVIPETDETGRSVSPNPWVLRYLQRWETPSSTESRPSRIPRSPIEQARCLYSLDPQQGSLLPPRFADFLDCGFPRPRLGPGGKVLEPVARIERRVEWYGEIASAAFAKDITDQRVSVTRLETLARCPFRFWASNIAHLESVDPPESREELDALTWGSLVHRVLENALRPVEGTRETLKSTATRLLGIEEDRLEDLIQSAIREAEIEFRLRPAVFRRACEVRLRETIHSYLRAIVKGECTDGIPLQTEVMAREVVSVLGSIRLSGQMDRIDRWGERIRIIDYKSGRLPWKSAKAKEQALGLGFVLQPLLYPLLYTTQSGIEEAPEFCYIFLGEQPPAEEFIARESYAPNLLEFLAELLRGGFFFPTSNQAFEEIGFDKVKPCAWCNFDSLCRRFESGRSSTSMNFLHRKVPGRFSGVKTENG